MNFLAASDMSKPSRMMIRPRDTSVSALSNEKRKYLRRIGFAQTHRLSADVEWPAKRGVQLFKIRLAQARAGKHLLGNIRAVPLVRKNDAHQGRVSFLPKFEAPRTGLGA